MKAAQMYLTKHTTITLSASSDEESDLLKDVFSPEQSSYNNIE